MPMDTARTEGTSRVERGDRGARPMPPADAAESRTERERRRAEGRRHGACGAWIPQWGCASEGARPRRIGPRRARAGRGAWPCRLSLIGRSEAVSADDDSVTVGDAPGRRELGMDALARQSRIGPGPSAGVRPRETFWAEGIRADEVAPDGRAALRRARRTPSPRPRATDRQVAFTVLVAAIAPGGRLHPAREWTPDDLDSSLHRIGQASGRRPPGPAAEREVA